MNLSQPLFNPSARVLVIGDAMLDRYFEGETRRISPEAPVPIVRVLSTFDRPGGAANVALNIAALGVGVTLLSYVGRDADATELERLLHQGKVATDLVVATRARTIVKMRALSMKQQIIRLDFEDDLGDQNHDEIEARFAALVTSHDLVVLSDYGKGCLARAQSMIETARASSRAVLVDPKGADFTRYAGATMLTPNLSEFIAVAGTARDDNDLVDRARSLCEAIRVDEILVTRGEAGMTLVQREASHTVPAHAREVFDVTGAGDTVIATMAAGIVSGLSSPVAMTISNHAAGIVVSRKGTASVTNAELMASLGHVDGSQSAEDVIAEVVRARAQGQRIVMTNGCFDILHSGHVDYLTRARALGDRLLVAVNSDDSVRRLKGASRPFNELKHRLAVLAGLRAIDWVVAFDGSVDAVGVRSDTPLDLIMQIRPDILVKGGDYDVENTVGAIEVKSWGGQTVILPFVHGQSTTGLATKIVQVGQPS